MKINTPHPNFTAKPEDLCAHKKYVCPEIYVPLFSPELLFMTNWKTIQYFREVHKYTSNKIITKFISCKSYYQKINSKKEWSFID